MRGCIDEVAERYEGSRKTNGGAIESSDQNLGMCIEGIGDFKVIGYEALERLTANVSGSWKGFRNGDIGATVFGQSMEVVIGSSVTPTHAEK